MGKQLNRHAVPWEPNKVPVPQTQPQPPPVVTYQIFPTNNYISDRYSYYYSYYYYTKEEEFTTYYNYNSSYNNNTTHHHSFGDRKVVETYKRAAVRRIDGGCGGGPTELGGGLKRVNVPPRFRGRLVEGRVRRRSFGLQWKPKAKTTSKSDGGGSGGGCSGGGGSGGGCSGGGEVSCEVALAPAGGGGGDERVGCDGKTSVMIKNIPNHYRREMLVQLLDTLCEKNQLEYDFLYLPMDFLRKNSLGYAFVNFTSAAAARRIRELLQGYKWGRIQTHCGSFSSSKICEVTFARIQGKEALVQNFANSTFCCDTTEWLPVTFTPPRNGLSPGSSEQRTIGKWRARITY